MKATNTETLEHLGLALFRLRDLTGLSQQAVASECQTIAPRFHVSSERLERWENGQEQPSLGVLGQVLEVLGRSLIDQYDTATMPVEEGWKQAPELAAEQAARALREDFTANQLRANHLLERLCEIVGHLQEHRNR